MFFGIFALILVGLSWTAVGVVMGLAPKKNTDPGLIQLCGALVSITASLVIINCMPDKILALSEICWVFAAYASSGFLNSIMLVLMSRAMQRGPNGIIWTIIQSAMIFPFLMGIVIFGVEPKLIRFSGLLLILVSLAVFGIFKDNTVKDKKWKMLTFIAFAMTGVILSLAALPSYFAAGRNISPILRTMFTASGVFSGSLLVILVSQREINIISNLKSRYLWIFVAVLQGFGLIFAYLFLYPGLDALAANGIGSASHPLLIGSCVAGFFIYSAFILREKICWQQYIGIFCCILGIVFICC
ncbi:MAG: hypothetical protein IKB71_09325 [Lentisphaeria bacterium]|nr:hypothetical protein [Lentisphaeria bacterium]